MSTHFVFENAEQIKALLKEMPEVAMQACSGEMEKIGRDVVERAQDDHRFNTRSGDLERSMKSKVIDGTAGGSKSIALEVLADMGVAKYARRIHYGWGTWTADRFLENAFWRFAKGEGVKSMGDRLMSAMLKAINKAKGKS